MAHVMLLRMQMKLTKSRHYLLRPILECVFGSASVVGGFVLEFSNETPVLPQPFIYASLGLLCIFLGSMLLLDGILSHFERKSAQS